MAAKRFSARMIDEHRGSRQGQIEVTAAQGRAERSRKVSRHVLSDLAAIHIDVRAILKLAPLCPAIEAATKYEAELTQDLPLAPDASVLAYYVTREALYRLVWEAPVSEVAARFGISDVGPAKACRRVAIPIPPRGYWAKTEAGILVEQPLLSPSPPGLREKIRIRNRSIQKARADSKFRDIKAAA